MIDEKQETVADVLVDFRQYVSNTKIPFEVAETIVCYLDRIKAAANREKAETEADALAVGGIVEAARTTEKSSAVGNSAAMRETLTKLVAYLDKEFKRTAKCKMCKFNGKSFRGEPCYWHVNCGIDQNDDEASDNALYLIKKFKLKEALFEPPRNCDVGTAEEQAERMRLYCNSHGVDESGCFRCAKCPLLTVKMCWLAWAQMPYEAQEGGAK